MPTMPTHLEMLQGAMINTYLASTKLPMFKNQPYFSAGVMQPSFDRLWDHPDKLSSGERLIFEVAREIWKLDGKVKIYDLCLLLSSDLVDLTFSLYKAWLSGNEATVKWIFEHGGQQWLTPLIQTKE